MKKILLLILALAFAAAPALAVSEGDFIVVKHGEQWELGPAWSGNTAYLVWTMPLFNPDAPARPPVWFTIQKEIERNTAAAADFPSKAVGFNQWKQDSGDTVFFLRIEMKDGEQRDIILPIRAGMVGLKY
jgi:hypothetical protein